MSQKKLKKLKRIFLTDNAIAIIDTNCIALSKFVEKKLLELKSEGNAASCQADALALAPTKAETKEGEI